MTSSPRRLRLARLPRSRRPRAPAPRNGVFCHGTRVHGGNPATDSSLCWCRSETRRCGAPPSRTSGSNEPPSVRSEFVLFTRLFSCVNSRRFVFFFSLRKFFYCIATCYHSIFVFNHSSDCNCSSPAASAGEVSSEVKRHVQTASSGDRN
jgi:hypothetical protein